MNAKLLAWTLLGVTSLALAAARDYSDQQPPVVSRGSRRRLRKIYGR